MSDSTRRLLWVFCFFVIHQGEWAQAQIKQRIAAEAEVLSIKIPPQGLAKVADSALQELWGRLPIDLQEIQKIEATTTSLVPNYQAATVGIQVGIGQGSGVVISPDGYVLTAAHVVGETGNSLIVLFPDGRRHRARVTGVDTKADAAIVRMEGRGPYPFVPMAQNRQPKTGHWVIAVGHPNGYAFNRMPVVRLGRVIQNAELTVQTDCSLVGGDSGGPLFDMYGRVVGIHSRIGINNSINFHVPIEIYLQNWDEFTKGAEDRDAEHPPDRPQKAYLGIRGRDSAGGGCLITEVTPTGPAAQAGLKRGDLIIEVEQEKVQNFADLVKILKSCQPEQKIQIKIRSVGIEKTVSVELVGTEI